MPTRDLQPEGKLLVVEAVHRLDAANAKLAEAERAIEQARAEVDRANAELDELLAHGRCGPDCGPALSGSKTTQSASQEPIDEPGIPALNDESVKIVWRIAFQLWRDPVLDYQYVARQIWGPDLDKTTAKNRVNAHVTQLRKDEIVKSLGNNTFEVDDEKFRERCPITVPRRRPEKAAQGHPLR